MPKKILGIELSNLSESLRQKYKIKATINGVVITGIDASSPAADKRLVEGEVIVEVAQDAVSSVDQFETRIDKLKKEGRHSGLVLLSRPDGELRFVALNLK